MSNLHLSFGINNMLKTLKAQAIDAILSTLKERGHLNIELHKPINYAELNDDWVTHQGSFKVVRVEHESVIVNFNNCQEPEELKNLSTDQLVELLMVIENNGYSFDTDDVV